MAGNRTRAVAAAFGLAALAAAVAGALRFGPGVVERIPPRWNPWAPLTLTAPPDRFLRFRLDRLSADPAQCRRLLDEAAAVGDLEYVPVPDRVTAPGCGFTNAVRISATSASIGREPIAMSCPAAASLALWERHVLQPAAVARFGSAVRRIEHYGTYACRGLYHRTAGPRSRHASADAFDVAGFVLEDGRRIRVLKDWGGEAGADEAAFLREVRDGACRYFDAVLSPDYNAAHRDHFHLDRGPYRACR